MKLPPFRPYTRTKNRSERLSTDRLRCEEQSSEIVVGGAQQTLRTAMAREFERVMATRKSDKVSVADEAVATETDAATVVEVDAAEIDLSPFLLEPPARKSQLVRQQQRVRIVRWVSIVLCVIFSIILLLPSPKQIQSLFGLDTSVGAQNSSVSDTLRPQVDEDSASEATNKTPRRLDDPNKKRTQTPRNYASKKQHQTKPSIQASVRTKRATSRQQSAMSTQQNQSYTPSVGEQTPQSRRRQHVPSKQQPSSEDTASSEIIDLVPIS